MIEKKIIYKIEFTEEQVKDLYDLLEGEYHEGTLEINHDELIVIHNELKKLFGWLTTSQTVHHSLDGGGFLLYNDFS